MRARRSSVPSTWATWTCRTPSSSSTLQHKWEEIADPSGWRVWIEDDLGRRFAPEDSNRRGVRAVTTRYEVGRRGSVNLSPLYLVTVFRGEGDYGFYRRDLLRPKMRWLMLIMVRPGYEYRYVWSFGDGEEWSQRRSIVRSSHPI
jgi:hypothetical protein